MCNTYSVAHLFVITSLCFSQPICNVFCHKYVLIGFLCVYAKNRNRDTNFILYLVSCLWRIPVDWRITNIQEQSYSGQAPIIIPMDLTNCKQVFMQDEALSPPHHQAAEFGYEYWIQEPWSFLHLVRLKQLPLDFQRLLEDLPFFFPP